MKQRNISRWPRWAVMGLTLVLGACASPAPPPPQPAVPPQVIYRIDDHRYFEVTPESYGCDGDMMSFVDTAKGIHSEIVKFDQVMNRTTLIIDAANDQYLVAPVTRGGTNCSSGGGFCSGDQMPYSTDGGRTWKFVWSPGTTFDLMVSRSTAYQSHRIVHVVTDGLDLARPHPRSSDWKGIHNFVLKPRIAPIDTTVWCSSQGKPRPRDE